MKIKILMGLVFMFLLFPLVQAMSLGVSPVEFVFDNMTREGFASGHGLISTMEKNDMIVSYDVLGQGNEWIDVDLGDGVFSKSKPLEFNVTVSPSEDAANGGYHAIVRFFLSIDFSGQEIESRIFTGLYMDVYFNIVGEETVDCIIGGVSVPDTEDGYPLGLYLTVKNNGNVRVSPTIDVTVWDQSYTSVLHEDSFFTSEVLPTMEDTKFKELIYDLAKGQYWIEVSSRECIGSDLKTFSVLGLGEVSDRGELLRLEIPEVTGKEEIIPVKAYFKNTGIRFADAKLRATVSLDGQIVDVIESDELEVGPNEIVALEAFFEPETEGNYVVKGQVVYNNKLSYEKAANLIVSELDPNAGVDSLSKKTRGYTQGQGSWLVFLLLVIVIGVLVGLIVQKKRR